MSGGTRRRAVSRADDEILVALENLARGRQIGIFDRPDHDARFDALVLGEDVNHLLQFGRHMRL